MSNLALDLTEGIDPNPFRDKFGKARNLLWPVSVHRITIPVVGHGYRELNAFEAYLEHPNKQLEDLLVKESSSESSSLDNSDEDLRIGYHVKFVFHSVDTQKVLTVKLRSAIF